MSFLTIKSPRLRLLSAWSASSCERYSFEFSARAAMPKEFSTRLRSKRHDSAYIRRCARSMIPWKFPQERRRIAAACLCGGLPALGEFRTALERRIMALSTSAAKANHSAFWARTRSIPASADWPRYPRSSKSLIMRPRDVA